MSSADDNISISAAKASFLQTQTRLLSAPLHISVTYPHLQKRVSDRISQHGKAVFSSQSIGHVAEQIETLAEEARRRYVQLRARLVALAKQRGEARRRLQRYQRLQGLLRAYGDPKRRIQPNLVTAQGEMRRELERTRALLAQVKERSLAVPRGEAAAVGGRIEARTFEQKLQQVIELG
ncbi:hypothetical protein DV735_g4643, partial [Chaetothyriales sp. CBS 134920]